MSKNYNKRQAETAAKTAAPAATQKKGKGSRKGLHIGGRTVYAVLGLLLLFFCVWEFSPVLRHLAEENYFSFEALPMAYVLREPLGHVLWIGRFLMLPFHWQWVGGLYLAALLVISGWLADKALACKAQWRGIGFVLPALLLAWASWRGYNLFLRNEPSLLILWVWGLLIVSALAAGVKALLRKKTAEETAEEPVRWYKTGGLWLSTIALLAVIGGTYAFRQNVILSCDMQNKMMDADWEGMVDDALATRQPDRSVAAYHAIALNHQGQLLEHVFDIDYNYPTVKLDSIGGMDEGVNYIAESNFHCGLVQSGYHYAMEQHVMGGPRLRFLKLMALASMVNDERELCERYLHFIEKMPFEGEFCENVRSLLGNAKAIADDPTFGRILQFLPREQKFEQNFRTPPFLGYNVGVLSGTDETLNTSVAAALYSKDMENIIMRSQYLQQKRTLPLCVQQALVIASFKRPGLLDNFKGISTYVQNEVVNFATIAAPLSKDKSEKGKEAMRKALVKDWKGTYMFYYYCGNLNQTAQKQTQTNVN